MPIFTYFRPCQFDWLVPFGWNITYQGRIVYIRLVWINVLDAGVISNQIVMKYFELDKK